MKRFIYSFWVILASLTVTLAYADGVTFVGNDAGTTTVAYDGATRTTNIDTTDRSVSRYDAFNSHVGDTINVNHSVSGGTSLHRVVGGEASSLFGRLNSNGKVFLINPNGIVFGVGSSVDAAGLVASSLDISNEDFLVGRYVFATNGSAGAVVNNGDILIRNGGYLALLAPQVRHGGSIIADLGKVALASGERVTLNLDDAGDISVVVNEPTRDAQGGVTVDGQISAGQIIIDAGTINLALDQVVNNTGISSADIIIQTDGIFELVAGEVISTEGDITINAGGDLLIGGPGYGIGGSVEIVGDLETTGTIVISGGEIIIDSLGQLSGLTGGTISVSSFQGVVFSMTGTIAMAQPGQAANVMASVVQSSMAVHNPAPSVSALLAPRVMPEIKIVGMN